MRNALTCPEQAAMGMFIDLHHLVALIQAGLLEDLGVEPHKQCHRNPKKKMATWPLGSRDIDRGP